MSRTDARGAVAVGVVPGGEELPPPPRQVATIWMLLLVNVLGFLPATGAVLPIPKPAGQVVTMGALVVAFVLALVLNPRVRLRATAFLMLLSGIALVALTSSMLLESGLGALLRTLRFVLFVATMWLLTRWWRPDLALVRIHVRAITAVLFVVALGIVVAPGAAFSGPDGRLVGALWPIPAPQVGQYCAVVIGLLVLLRMARQVDTASALVIAVPSAGMLLLSHTRTAIAGLVAGLAVALVSQLAVDPRVRRLLLGATALLAAGALTVGDLVLTWLARGQDRSELTSLTGRQKVWDSLLSTPRTVRQEWLGVGLTDKSFDGLPIDSAWLVVYHELGRVGVVLVIAMLGVLVLVALLRPPGPARACALFLVVYCIVASYTEVGLGDPSPYLLHLTIAASLLALPPRSVSRDR